MRGAKMESQPCWSRGRGKAAPGRYEYPGSRRTQLRKPRTEISTIVWVVMPCMCNVRTDGYIDLFNI
jgi:hypothetical protein